MKATLYQALDWFDAQGTFLDVATIGLLILVLGVMWMGKGKGRAYAKRI